MTHVTKETAVLLKGKGFDLPCLAWYIVDDDIMRSTTDFEEDSNGRIPNAFTAPELYKVPIWLRETKGVHVDVSPSVERNKWVSFIYVIEDGRTVMVEKAAIALSHDLALEAGIIHALKHYVK